MESQSTFEFSLGDISRKSLNCMGNGSVITVGLQTEVMVIYILTRNERIALKADTAMVLDVMEYTNAEAQSCQNKSAIAVTMICLRRVRRQLSWRSFWQRPRKPWAYSIYCWWPWGINWGV